ncbi:MAG: putative toxin-antitoxin system toxin component, PIN family [Thermoplasmata archaeon]|nr:MAG: putative toxin-antitoxin system toxin component, PIN family [Thermoplasmata archaeon]
MKVVLDTNVLISGIYWEGNESIILKACKMQNLTNYISPETLEEFKKVLFYNKFKLTPSEIELAIETVLSFSTVITPKIKLNVIKIDPVDNIFLECALASHADCIISGDKHLLKLGSYKKIEIMKSKDFIKKYKNEIE